MILYLYIYIYIYIYTGNIYIYVCVLTYHIYILHKWYKSVYIIFIPVHIDMHLYTYIYIDCNIYIYIYIHKYVYTEHTEYYVSNLGQTLVVPQEEPALECGRSCHPMCGQILANRDIALAIVVLRHVIGIFYLTFLLLYIYMYIYTIHYIKFYVYIYILHTLYTNKCYIYMLYIYIYIILHNLMDAQPTVLLGAQPTCSHLAV